MSVWHQAELTYNGVYSTICVTIFRIYASPPNTCTKTYDEILEVWEASDGCPSHASFPHGRTCQFYKPLVRNHYLPALGAIHYPGCQQKDCSFRGTERWTNRDGLTVYRRTGKRIRRSDCWNALLGKSGWIRWTWKQAEWKHSFCIISSHGIPNHRKDENGRYGKNLIRSCICSWKTTVEKVRVS